MFLLPLFLIVLLIASWTDIIGFLENATLDGANKDPSSKLICHDTEFVFTQSQSAAFHLIKNKWLIFVFTFLFEKDQILHYCMKVKQQDFPPSSKHEILSIKVFLIEMLIWKGLNILCQTLGQCSANYISCF